jgi:hypothetical protein
LLRRARRPSKSVMPSVTFIQTKRNRVNRTHGTKYCSPIRSLAFDFQSNEVKGNDEETIGPTWLHARRQRPFQEALVREKRCSQFFYISLGNMGNPCYL